MESRLAENVKSAITIDNSRYSGSWFMKTILLNSSMQELTVIFLQMFLLRGILSDCVQKNGILLGLTREKVHWFYLFVFEFQTQKYLKLSA